MYRITLFVDFEQEDILDTLTGEYSEPFEVFEEELHEDGTVSFVLQAQGHQEEFLERMSSAPEVTASSAIGDSSILVRKQAKGAAEIIRRHHGKLNGVDRVFGTKRVFDVLLLRKSDLRPMVEELGNITTVELERVVEISGKPTEVTDRQYETVAKALELGYFDWPRESDSHDLADELGISHPTALEHLRKGEKKLLQRALGEEPTITSDTEREFLLDSPVH